MVSPDLPPINISQEDRSPEEMLNFIKKRSEKVQTKLVELDGQQIATHGNLSSLASQISNLDGKNVKKSSKDIKKLTLLKAQVSKLEDSAIRTATLQKALLTEQSRLVQTLETIVNDKLPTMNKTFEEGLTKVQNATVYPLDVATENGVEHFNIPKAFYLDISRSDFRINGKPYSPEFTGNETEDEKDKLIKESIKNYIKDLMKAGLDKIEINYLLRKVDQNFMGAATVELMQGFNPLGFSPRPTNDFPTYNLVIQEKGKPISLTATSHFNILQNVEVNADNHDLNIAKVTARVVIDDISQGNAPIDEPRTLKITFNPFGRTKTGLPPQSQTGGLQKLR